MADIAAQVPTQVEQVPSKKGRKSRKALKPKNAPETGVNVLAWQASKSPLKAFAEPGKENLLGLSSPTNYGKVGLKPKESIQSSADQLLVLQKKLEQMQIEMKKTEELLKERDEMLKRKEEELENRGREQEKLQKELKKLQKLKEFKPSVNIPVAQSLQEKEQEKKEKKGGHEIKRPCPPYSLWCKDQWKEVKKENPDADFKEISNIIGARWKKLTSEEKKPYEEKYHAAKEIYLRIIGKEKREQEALKLLDEEQKQKTAMELLDQYLVFKQETEEEGKKRRKKQRDPLRPKHPMSAFFLFSNERRAALLAENKNLLEVSKILGEEWSNMKEHKRAPYEEIARKQKEEYLRQMEIYKQKKAEEAAISKREEEEQMKVHKQEALQLLKKKEKTENIIKKTKEQKKKHKLGKNVDPNRPRKPATSFFLFSKETRKQLLQERLGINNSTLRALVSVKWKEMSEDEKELWKKKASIAMEAYRGEMEEYNKLAATAEKPQQQS